jgi:anti-sigma-K factor RskA
MDHPDDETLGQYVGGLLDARERATVDAHVAACPECARRLEELREMNEVLERLPPLAVSASLPERVRARLLIAAERGRLTFWRTAAAAVALLAIGGALGATLAQQGPAPAPLVRDAEGPKFMMIFAEDPESLTGASSAERERRMNEFLTWMRGLGDTTVRLGGAQLDDARGRVVGASVQGVTPDLVLSGFLVIRASSYDDVEAVARRCPIVARGGQVIVRQLR